MSQNDLSPTRLRELITDAAIEEETCFECGACLGGGSWRLVDYLIDHGAALADDMEKARLLEWAADHPLRWNAVYFKWDGESDFIDALRAAKEATDAKA